MENLSSQSLTDADAGTAAGSRPSLTSPEFLGNPYPAWAWLREHAPVHFSEEWNGFLLTRYADVVAGLREPRLISNRIAAYAAKLPPPLLQTLSPVMRHFLSFILFTDGAAHTRLRGLLNRAFAPRLMESLRPRVQLIVNDLVAKFADADSVDIIAGLAVPLPVLVIGEILGLPAADRHLLKQWSYKIGAFLGARQMTPELLAQTVQMIAELEQYFRDLIAERRRREAGHEDLLAALMSAEDNGAILSEQELLSTCSAVLFGGHETTTNLIGNAALVLAQQKDAQAALRQDPSSIPAAVEEVLRFEAPVQRQGRLCGEDLELHGHKIRKGQLVFLVLGAANHDPRQFPEPHIFNPRRSDNRHLAFGFGGHFCIGAALARMEGQLAVEGLLRALPTFKRAPEPLSWIDNLTIHGLHRLQLQRV